MLSVVLPTYEEADNIGDLMRALRAVLRPQDELIVVDDDSPDGTWRSAEDARARTAPATVIRRVGRRGLAGAVAEGFAAAKGDLVAAMDCDFSMPPELLPGLAAAVERGEADVAVASRYAPGAGDGRGGEPVRRAASLLLSRLGSALLVPGVRDYSSGFFVARRKVVDDVPLRGDYGEYFMDFIVRAHRRGFRVVEAPYTLGPRRAGSSKTDDGFCLKGARYLVTMMRLALSSS